MFCDKCGAEIKTDEKFCYRCGAQLGSAKENSAPEEPVGKKKKRRTVVAGVVAVLLFVLALALFVVLFVVGGKDKKYDRQLTLAERYLDELNYDRAIAAYKEAIGIDPARTDAYKGLAELYEEQGRTEEALDILKEGYEASGDRLLKRRLEKLEERLQAAEAPPGEEVSGNEGQGGGEALPEEEEDGPGMLALLLLSADEKTPVSGASLSLRDKNGDYSRSGITITNGRVELDYPGRGEYALTVTADKFVSRTLEFHLEPGYNEKIVPLVPTPLDQNVYVLLEWDGEQDLDLCSYNSEAQEYINVSHRWIDSSAAKSGGDYFYLDNGAAERFELLSLSRYSEPNGVDKRIYVIDTYVVQNGGRSEMEKLGVDVSVYEKSGQLYRCTAKPSEDAAVWYPCYYRDGAVYAVDEYLYNLDGEYDWADLGIHNRAGIKLTKEDRALLFDLSYALMCIIPNDTELDKTQLKQYIKDHLDVFISNFAYRHFTSVRKETGGEYGMEIKYYYDPKEIEKTVNDLFGMSVDLSRDLGNNTEPDWSDSGVGGCDIENGYLRVYYFEGGEPSDYTNYFSNKTIGGKLQLVYSFHNQYAFDETTYEALTLGYLNLFVTASDNDPGYELDSLDYQHIMDW